MKNYLILAGLTVCSLSLVSSTAHADPTSQARQQIQAHYNSQDAALARKNVQGAVAYTDPAYIGTGIKVEAQTYEDRVTELPRMFSMVKSIHLSHHIDQLVLHGNTAAVHVRTQQTLTATDPKTNHVRSVTVQGTLSDTWVKHVNTWMLLRSRILAIKGEH